MAAIGIRSLIVHATIDRAFLPLNSDDTLRASVEARRPKRDSGITKCTNNDNGGDNFAPKTGSAAPKRSDGESSPTRPVSSP